MSFLTPFFLLLGLMAIPIIMLYMLRLRRREVLVSSTMLWQKLLRDREANAPWQRLRRNLLLLLQLLILAALVMALARPFLPVPTVIGGSVVVLLDGSPSMLAADVLPTRFAAAKEEVASLIGDLRGSDQMTLILVGRSPQVLASASSDANLLRRALDEAEIRPAVPDWPAAFALASGAAQGFREARIIIVSDGGLPDDLPPLSAEATFLPVGIESENLAISALAIAEAVDGPQLFASITNYGRIERQALFSLSLAGTLFDSRRVTVPAGESANLFWDLPVDSGDVTARLSELEADYLIQDNMAWAVYESGLSNRALLVTEGNRFLETVFSVLPGIEAFRASPGAELAEQGNEAYDLYIFDSVPLPSPLPTADMLIIHPLTDLLEPRGEDTDRFTVTGVFSNTNIVRLAESPLLQYVDWGNVHVRQALRVEAPWAQSLVLAEGGPLLLAGERGGHRTVIVPFRLQESDLPLQIAFPVLMANIIDWLNPGRSFATPDGLQPAVPINISPGATTTAVIVQKPDGTIWIAPVDQDIVLFSETEQLGLYRVEMRDLEGDHAAGSFAVNLFDPAESSIRPAESLHIGQITVAVADEENVGQRELWPWLVAAAFTVLLVEWWVHHRGTQVPGRTLALPLWFGRFRGRRKL